MEANNMAAMREALIIAKKAICHHAEHICQSLSWENSDIQSNCADILCAHRDSCEAKTAINAALAKPPRNCEFYNDVEDAWQDYKQFRRQTGEAVYFDMVHFWPFAKWLLAPAAEQKGETDGSK